MEAIPYSQARASLADLFEDAIEHLPTRIDRRRAAPAVLISLEDLRTLLAGFDFHPEVLFESAAVGIWLPELAIWGRGGSFEDARADLLDEIDELLAQLAASPRLRAAPNIVEVLPWIFRLMLADTDDERRKMLFAHPAEEPRALAAAST
ncbi:MAG: type II toxin-antitoxin system Phd/YefM family antitoxin [Chloroflexota bacterium]|nr:type II toxin-antitoxin system Phd/YefM family antitoxin [Chloroflexota bacterium]